MQLTQHDLVVVALQLLAALIQVAPNGPAARCRGPSSGKTTSLAFCRHMMT
jgi:hypothetical protein